MRIGCVLVLYNPNENILKKTIRSVEDQVDVIFVSDNTPSPYFVAENYSPKIVYQRMNGNVGIAAAQNVGVRYFQERGFDFVFYLDQDSIVQENMVASLVANYNKLLAMNIKVGAVGPRPVNRQSNKKYVGSVKKGVAIQDSITEVTELISSASLIPVGVFRTAGLMDETLFIDGVDHEWCWRAHKQGQYRFFICEDVLLSHQLGEGDRFFVVRKVAIPTPFRTYYQYRNYFLLIRREYVPMYWKLSNGFKYFIKIFYYPIFIAPRNKYFVNIWKGIYAGIFLKL